MSDDKDSVVRVYARGDLHEVHLFCIDLHDQEQDLSMALTPMEARDLAYWLNRRANEVETQ